MLPSLSSLQSVSVKGAAFHLMAARVEGYDPDQTLSHKDAKGEYFDDKSLAGKVIDWCREPVCLGRGRGGGGGRVHACARGKGEGGGVRGGV